MATPLTDGLIPIQRLAPAFPRDLRECSEFDTTPIVALQFDKTLLISPLLSRRVTYLPSIANICAEEPALLEPFELLYQGIALYNAQPYLEAFQIIQDNFQLI